MSFINNFMKSMRLDQEDDYDLDDDYGFDDGYEEEEPQRPSLFRKAQNQDEYEEEPKPRLFGKSRGAAQNQQRKSGMEVTMIKPSSMDDSRDICDYLLNGKAVVLNMEGLHSEIAQRIIDFTCGAAYAIDGNLQKISNYIFIATPENVELSGDFQNILAGGTEPAVGNVGGLNIRM
ncbi:cell division protein SepF [Oribacterium sp. oral taxon 102]|uniref:cell division protein SepF n=1 Tax=Oribacterium sp. oral taxon 102 TaxID=671214 RepID=UPI0015BE6996|nr:cell division protein SepF [Oribacterium sp. oral taxon 102]NWO21636.1 cell division protein SepF [Oribacterium sp. oral taxon 102]